jgi:hypothetical protein
LAAVIQGLAARSARWQGVTPGVDCVCELAHPLLAAPAARPFSRLSAGAQLQEEHGWRRGGRWRQKREPGPRLRQAKGACVGEGRDAGLNSGMSPGRRQGADGKGFACVGPRVSSAHAGPRNASSHQTCPGINTLIALSSFAGLRPPSFTRSGLAGGDALGREGLAVQGLGVESAQHALSAAAGGHVGMRGVRARRLRAHTEEGALGSAPLPCPAHTQPRAPPCTHTGFMDCSGRLSLSAPNAQPLHSHTSPCFHTSLASAIT